MEIANYFEHNYYIMTGLLNNIVWLSLMSRRKERMVKLIMHVCPYTGEFLGGPIFVAFKGIMFLSMKIRPTKNLYSIEWV